MPPHTHTYTHTHDLGYLPLEARGPQSLPREQLELVVRGRGLLSSPGRRPKTLEKVSALSYTHPTHQKLDLHHLMQLHLEARGCSCGTSAGG